MKEEWGWRKGGRGEVHCKVVDVGCTRRRGEDQDGEIYCFYVLSYILHVTISKLLVSPMLSLSHKLLEIETLHTGRDDTVGYPATHDGMFQHIPVSGSCRFLKQQALAGTI